jgi:hypothetical protein
MLALIGYHALCLAHHNPIPASAAPSTSAAIVTGGPKALHEQFLKTCLPLTTNRRRQKAQGEMSGSTCPGSGH